MLARRLAPILVLACLAGEPVSFAEELVVTLAPDRTEIRFVLDATAHKVRGTARLLRGQIRLDTDTGDVAGEIVVDATSAETGRKSRDQDMHEKVLESETYPTIVLRPVRVAGFDLAPGAMEATVSGRFEIHGDEHELDLPLTVTIEEDRVTATGSFVVPYVEWGMKDPSFFVFRVGKTVDVEIRAEGTIRVAGEQ